jgi:hypothetical protein
MSQYNPPKKTGIPISQLHARSAPHVHTSSTGICVAYVQLATYISYHIATRGLTRYAYIPTCPARTLPYPPQLACMCP